MASRRLKGADARTVRSAPAEPARFTATQAKNEFGRALEMALHGDSVIITKHDAPKAILMSVEQFEKLTHAAERSRDTLAGEFDALMVRMQTPKARAAMKSALASSPRELAAAAVTSARKRG
jgi:antitoxin Phd